MSKRNVRIYLRFSQPQGQVSPVAKAIEQVAKLLTSAEFVRAIGDADLILTDEVRQVERDWDKSKQYALLSLKKNNGQLPENMREVSMIDNLLVSLITIINEVSDKITDDTPDFSELEGKAFVRKSPPVGAKRLLVIDDTPANIQSALETVPESYELVTATGSDEAMELLGKEKFDIVLTDLHMPMSSKTLGDKAFKLGELVPYGLLIVMEVLRRGAEKVVVVTDLNHHADPFSAAFDHFTGQPMAAGSMKIELLHAPLRPDGSKDWGKVLE